MRKLVWNCRAPVTFWTVQLSPMPQSSRTVRIVTARNSVTDDSSHCQLEVQSPASMGPSWNEKTTIVSTVMFQFVMWSHSVLIYYIVSFLITATSRRIDNNRWFLSSHFIIRRHLELIYLLVYKQHICNDVFFFVIIVLCEMIDVSSEFNCVCVLIHLMSPIRVDVRVW